MIVAAALDRGVLGGRRFGLGVLQRRESHRANHPVAIRKLACSVVRVVLGAVAVQTERGGRVYARRAAVLCSDECTPRDGLSHAQKEGRRAWCVLPAAPDAFGALC